MRLEQACSSSSNLRRPRGRTRPCVGSCEVSLVTLLNSPHQKGKKLKKKLARVGFAGTGAGEEGGAQGQGHRTHELTSHPAPGAVARAAPGSLDPQSGRRQATQRIRRQSLEPHVRDRRRLSEEIRRGADRVLAADHRVHDDVRGEAVQLRHNAVDAQCRTAACGTPAATRARCVVRRVRALDLLESVHRPRMRARRTSSEFFLS